MKPYPLIRDFFWLLLLPVSLTWALVMDLRRRWRRVCGSGYRSQLPVVCVGNLHAGGAGKTPLVEYLAKELSSWAPVILSRGYGGSGSRKGAWVEPSRLTASIEFGDEPVYLARVTGKPVRIGADRVRAAKAVEARYPNGLLLLDDGFQNFGLRYDVSLVVIPETTENHWEKNWWERYTHPLGSLRETAAACRDASAVVIVSSPGASGSVSDGPVSEGAVSKGAVGSVTVGEGTGNDETTSRRRGLSWKTHLGSQFPQLPIFEMRALWGGLFIDDKPYTVTGSEVFGAFCGIARPERFFSTLQKKFPTQLRVFRQFGDHHRFSSADLDRLCREGQQEKLTHWITTEKDRVRLAESNTRLGVPVLTARIQYDISEGLVEFIQRKLEST